MTTLFTQGSSKLTIICGPMYSSKTSTLIIDLTRYADIDLSVLYINSSDDTRGDIYSTHNSSLHQLSSKVKTLKETNLMNISDDILSNFKVFGIDESQFFDDLVPFVKKLLKMKKIIYISGLDGDSNQNLFGHFYELIPYATEVKKLTAVCELCKKYGMIVPAGVTIRKYESKTSDVKQVGGKETYIPVCNDCLFKNKSMMEYKDLTQELNYVI
jgi:thymidine kinase